MISSPQVDPSVACGTGVTGGSTRITGTFDDGEARELALLISTWSSVFTAAPLAVELHLRERAPVAARRVAAG